ncbi:MAG: TerB family tellurite resistance protein [Alphaproteobacteria bacterium]|nr:TerB family tellurite resistance protein [Alphaproteobacteria bacterium]
MNTAAALDVDTFSSSARIAGADRGLSWILRLDRSLGELDAMVDEVLPVLADTFGVGLDPAAGVDTLVRIDRLVAGLRPEDTGTDGAFPVHVLMALGLVATRTVRDLAGGGAPCTSTDDGAVATAVTLGDAGGFPALHVDGVVSPVAQTVVKRWYGDDDSLQDVWAQLQVRREAGPVPSAEPTAPREHTAVPPELLRLGSLAPFAGFLMVAMADGKVEPHELFAFRAAMWRSENALFRQLVVHCPLEAHAVQRHLAERPDLLARSLAAAGAVFDMHPDGEGARKDFMRLLTTVAQSHGELRSAELNAITEVVAHTKLGAAFALSGDEPFPGEYDYALVSIAPIAGFLLVVAADGEFEEAEGLAFQKSLDRVKNPLLERLLAMSMGEFEHHLKTLVADPQLAKHSLEAAGEMFRTHPEGPAAREAFLAMLRNVAECHGELRAPERRALGAIEHILDGTEPVVWPTLALFTAVPMSVVLCGWIGIAALSGAGLVLPIALGLQLALLAVVSFLFRGQGFGGQVLTGTVASGLSGVAVTVWTVLVSLLFPVAPGAAALGAATFGFGLVASTVLGALFRAR